MMKVIRKYKKFRVYTGIVLTILGLILMFSMNNQLLANTLFVVGWLVAGIDVFIHAFQSLKNKRMLAEHFLMTIATIGALFIGEFMEAALVIVLYQIGELLQDRAVDKSRDSIAELMDITAPTAFRLENGERVEIDTDEIEIGDLLEVRAGEKIPVDGVVTQGQSVLDVSALTGESLPEAVEVGSHLLSGSINGDNRIIMRAEKEADDSTAMRIVELLEEATENKAETETIITRFSRVYTPIVVVLAILLATLPPLLIPGAVFTDWFYRSLNFLVISCPCAFVISVPMSFVLGIGSSSKMGIIVKGGNVFEALSEVDTLALDKTGTITEGVFKVSHVEVESDMDNQEFMHIASAMEQGSNHPLAQAIRQHTQDEFGESQIEFDQIENIAGRGLKAINEDKEYIIGNVAFLNDYDIFVEENVSETESIIHLAQIKPSTQYLGHILMRDQVKTNVESTISGLEEFGVNDVTMLTGDRNHMAQAIASRVGINNYKAELLPADKLEFVKNQADASDRRVAFVGDGLNDAPVIAASNVGIAMGGIGSDATIEAADVVLLNDDFSSLYNIFKVSRETLKIARQNIVLSIGIKVIFMVLSALGLIPMWIAVFGDVGVTLIAILNAFRLYGVPKKMDTDKKDKKKVTTAAYA